MSECDMIRPGTLVIADSAYSPAGCCLSSKRIVGLCLGDAKDFDLVSAAYVNPWYAVLTEHGLVSAVDVDVRKLT